jgi:hypothetical protein
MRSGIDCRRVRYDTALTSAGQGRPHHALPGSTVGDVAGRGVSNTESPSVENLTARELADAVWLAHQWREADTLAAHADPADGSRQHEPDDIGTPPSLPPGAGAEPAESPGQPPPATGSQDSHRSLQFGGIIGLTQRRPGQSAAGPGTQAPPPLDRSIPAALRPLRQTVPSSHEFELDEDATAEHALVDPRWLPVFTAAAERRWDIVLVIDDSPTMVLWRSTAHRFTAILARQGAFQNVQVRLLRGDGERGFTLRGTAPDAPPHGISDLLDPSDRRIVLVLTDGGAPGWRSGAMQSVLRQWGRTLPVAVIHLLPWEMWSHTGLWVHRLRFRTQGSGVANAHLSWQSQVSGVSLLDETAEDTMPIPVLGLGARWLRPWSRLIAGHTSRWTDLPALLAEAQFPDEDVMDTGPIDPARQVTAFRATTSPLTYELATYLAAAPLDLEVMQSVQRALLPSSQLMHLSEFLGSGLVDPVGADQARMGFEFKPGIREELLATGRRAATAHVMRVVEDCLAAIVPEARGFGRTLDEEPAQRAEPRITALAESFLRVQIIALTAMSGNHLADARALSRKFAAVSASGPQARTPISAHVGSVRVGSTGSNSPRLDSSHQGAGAGPPSTSTDNAGRPRYGSDQDNEGVEVPTIAGPGMDEQRDRRGTAPAIWGGVPPRNFNFTGREDLLRQLEERLEPGATAAVLPQALQGLGGVGKSQLAVEYAYRHRNDFDLIWWIPAEEQVQIQTALVELGQRLELGVGSEANVAVNMVVDALRGSARASRRIPSNWLLIFDNAEDPEAVMEYLPNGGSGRILVTSRNSQWLNLARSLEVDVFKRAESIELLQGRGEPLSEADADRLATALGDLPLAIEQAAAWRAETDMPADEYIDLLNKEQAKMLALPGPLNYQRSVAAAWNLSLSKLETSNPGALRMLQVCAFFAPDPIPRSMFANARGVSVIAELDRVLRDRLRLGEATRDINRLALARIDHRTNSIQMHRLVQAVLIMQMSDEEQATMRHGAHLLLAANDPFTPDDSDQWVKYGQLYTHVRASNAIECEDSAVRELVYNQMKFLFYWGRHETSREMSQLVYEVWVQRLGPDHLDTLKAGRWLGFMLWVVGRFGEAAEFNTGLLETHQRILGDDHEDTLDAINSVAGDRRAQGDFDGALELSRANYRKYTQRFGSRDPLALNAAHNLGVSLRLSGLFAEALQLDEQTWDRKVDEFGADHALSLLTQVGLTLDRRELGDYIRARDEHEEIVARYRLVHGLLNPATLRAIRLQAAMRRKAGDHDGAMEVADEAFNGLNARYGISHPETIAAAMSRSINMRHAGDLKQARQIAVDVLDRYRHTLGDGHPHTLSACTVLAVIHRLLDDPDTARAFNEEARDGLVRRLGEDHPSSLVASINLGSDLHVLGEAQAAHDLDLATSARAEEVLGADHPTTLAAKANLAQDLRALGQAEASDALRASVVTSTVTRLGYAHPAVAEFADPEQRANCDIDPMLL